MAELCQILYLSETCVQIHSLCRDKHTCTSAKASGKANFWTANSICLFIGVTSTKSSKRMNIENQ